MDPMIRPGHLELVSPTAQAFIDDCCRFDDPKAFTWTHDVQEAHRVWAIHRRISPLSKMGLFSALRSVSVLDRLKHGPDPGLTGWKGLRLNLEFSHGKMNLTSMPIEFARHTVCSLTLTKEAAARLREFRLRLGTTNCDVVERLVMTTPFPPDFYGRGELPDDPPDGPRRRKRRTQVKVTAPTPEPESEPESDETP
jgi:hypothetical protein